MDMKAMPKPHTALRSIVTSGRTRRVVSRLHLALSLAIGLVVAILLNVIVYQAGTHRWDVSDTGLYRLSPRTKRLLADLKASVEIVVFASRSHDYHEDVRNLLDAYRNEMKYRRDVAFNVTYVDPRRDIPEVKALASRFELQTQDVIVVDMEGRRKFVRFDDLMEREFDMDSGQPVPRGALFWGERVLSSAILSVSRNKRPIVYMLEGHGEANHLDDSSNVGYGRIALEMMLDNIELRSLMLERDGTIPEDCDLLVIAGPQARFSHQELEEITRYLLRNGRLLALLHAGSLTGIEPLLERWGIRLGNDFVTEPSPVVSTGRQLVAITYNAQHPITRELSRRPTIFFMPRAVVPIETNGGGGLAEDRPQATALVSSTSAGWIEHDLSTFPPVFDPSADIGGPAPIAVAVEKGGGLSVGLQPARLVVIGDPLFVCNAAIEQRVGNNSDLFMNAVNWLLEREDLIDIRPKHPAIVDLQLTEHGEAWFVLVVGTGIPLVAALVGIGMVYWRRS